MKRFDRTSEVTTALVVLIVVVHIFIVAVPYWYVVISAVIVGSVVFDHLRIALKRSSQPKPKNAPVNALYVSVAVPFAPRMWRRVLDGARDLRGHTIVAQDVSRDDLGRNSRNVVVVYEQWLDSLPASEAIERCFVVPTRATLRDNETESLKRRAQSRLGERTRVEVTPTIQEVVQGLELSPVAPSTAALRTTAVLLLIALIIIVATVVYIGHRYL